MSREDFRAAMDDIFRDAGTDDKAAKYAIDARGVARFEAIGVASKAGPDIWDWFMGIDGFSTSLMAARLRHAKQNPYVKAAFVRLSSPGGTVSGTQDAAIALRELAAVKPVVVFAEDITASAAYWIASGASHIVANPTSEVGSIGVFSVMPDFSRMLENEGIKFNLVKSAPRKGDGTPGVAVSQDALDDTQRIVDDLHALFVADVAAGRGMRLKYERGNAGVKNVPDDGRVWLGQEALELGLVDSVGNMDDALAITHSLINDQFQGRKVKTMNKVAEALNLSADADEAAIVTALAEKVEARAVELAAAKEEAARVAAEKMVREATEKAAAEKLEADRSAFVDKMAADGLIKSCQVASANILVRANESAFREFVGQNAQTAPTSPKITLSGKVDVVGKIDTTSPEGRAALDRRATELMAANTKLSYSEAVRIALSESKN